MRAWSVLRQLLAATLCAVLVAPAYPGESTPPRSSSTPSHTYDAATLSKTRVWGSSEKILLHFRAVLLLSEKQHWGSAKGSCKNVVGSLVTYDYDAFGNLIHSTGSTPNNYLFAGEQFDPDLGLYYNRARYLSTSTGRFWSMDAYEGFAQEPQSLHKYLYTAGDPVNHADPSGRDFDLGSLQVAGAAFTTLATTALVSFQNVLGAIYINLYRVPEVIETASNYLTVGLGAFETLKFLGTNVLNYTEKYSSVPTIRGGEFETAAGANLDRWFPALDYWDKDTGVAVQIRSTTQTSSPQALLAVVQRAVNRVNNLPPQLKGLDRDGLPITIDRADIKAKGVLIGIPAKPLPWFGTFLQQVRQLSESEGVAVTVQFVENLEGETIEK
jgi:RHS repeat-associated protein